MRTATYFHCQLKPISRSAGKSVVNCAAYRTGSKLEDKHYGVTRDYTHKKDVVTSFTVAPDGAPAWACDTEALWNAVEKKENRKNSILSYEFEIALPNELDDAHRENITRNIAGWLRDEYGVAVTVGIHSGGERGNGKNDHAHIFMTTREITEAGWSKNKLRDFNVRPGQDNPEVDRVREQVAEFINSGLADNDSDERVTHESYRARGIDIEGTKHLGPAAAAMQRAGMDSRRGDVNREILDAREAIEARLVWQKDVVQPEVDATVERDLARRFGEPERGIAGDAPPPPQGVPADAPSLPHGIADTTPPLPHGVTDEVPPLHQSAAEDMPALAPASSPERSEELSGWRRFTDRVRAWQERGLALLRDESGAPQPEPTTPEPAAEPPAPEKMRRSWASMVKEAASHVLHGWQRRDLKEVAQGLSEAAGIVRDIASPEPPPTAAEPPGEPARPVADVDAAEPEARPPDAGAKAMSAFERFAASIDPWTLQPDDNPLSSLDSYRASFNEGGGPPPSDPQSPDSWSSLGDAYQRALRDRPALDGYDEPDAPEPKAPEPDYDGPDLDF